MSSMGVMLGASLAAIAAFSGATLWMVIFEVTHPPVYLSQLRDNILLFGTLAACGAGIVGGIFGGIFGTVMGLSRAQVRRRLVWTATIISSAIAALFGYWAGRVMTGESDLALRVQLTWGLWAMLIGTVLGAADGWLLGTLLARLCWGRRT